MKKIESLTPEQVAKFPEYVARWTDIGLCTLPADRGAAEQAIREMYGAANLPPPAKIVWCGSPLASGLTRAIILDKKLLPQIGDAVWDSVWASVRASVRASVGDSVWDSVRDSVRASVWASVRASGYGQHDADWLAFYEYFRIVCGLDHQTDAIIGHIRQSQSAGWYLPHANICWVSERHHLLLRDERGRLHCASGPAVMYPDGWAIYAWHGVRVPEHIIEQRDWLTVKQIMAEPNTEVRRVMRNLYGNDRFLIDAGAKELDASVNHGARLLSLRLPGDPVDIRMMELTCPSTGSKYFERVPPDTATAMDGLAWRFQVKPAEYEPTQQT